MTVFFINRFFYPDHSATSQILTDLAVHLAMSGQPICVVTSRQTYDNDDLVLPSEECHCRVRIVRVWTTRFGRQSLVGRAIDYLTFYVSAFLRLLFILQSGDVVVAKTDPPLLSVVVAITAKVRNARFINWLQDLYPEVAESLQIGGAGWVYGLLRSCRNWSLGVAWSNVVIGERMAERLVAEGINPQSIHVIHNWSDGCAIQPLDRDKNDLRREWNLEKSFVVGYSGNIGRAHEFDTILDAAERLKATETIRFLFIGGGAKREWMEKEVQRRGLANILFKPYQPRDYLALSLTVPDVHLISLQPAMEGLIVPSKFYGIAAAGRPTIFIGSTNGEISRILQTAQCGFSIDTGDSEQASRIIKDLADDKATCISLGMRARALFDQRFDKSHAMRAWGAIVEAATIPVAVTR